MGYLKTSWTEAEVLALPAGEHDFFERKAGQLLDDRHKFQETLSKALSAFANSGGGHIVLGQEDGGTFDGMPSAEGRLPIREWIEHKIRNLVAYPLEQVRVHAVLPEAGGSVIPPGRTVVVIDIGDSRLAPHQACFPADKPQYYYRAGGNSVPAPHHYLEVLRSRLTAAVLEPDLAAIHVGEAHRSSGDCPQVVELVLTFKVKNVSRIACYRWEIVASIGEPSQEGPRLLVSKAELPTLGSRLGGITIDKTILPTLSREDKVFLGIKFFGLETLETNLSQRVLPVGVHYYAISENHVGETRVKKISDVIDLSTLRGMVLRALGEQAGFRANPER